MLSMLLKLWVGTRHDPGCYFTFLQPRCQQIIKYSTSPYQMVKDSRLRNVESPAQPVKYTGRRHRAR